MHTTPVVAVSDRAGTTLHKGHGSQFPRKMEQAVAALMTHRNLEEAAQEVGISLSTLKRWKATREFRTAYLAARQAALSETRARLQQQSEVYVTVLLKAMVNTDNSAAVRERAAASVVQMAHRGLQLEALERRLAALEGGAQAPGTPEPPPGAPTGEAGPPPRGHGSQLPRKLEAAAAALATQRTLEDAARVAGVAESTLKRWKKLPEFQAACMAVRREILFQAGALLQKHVPTAVTVLGQLAVGAKTPSGVQVRAAKCLLQLAYAGLEDQDLEPRLAALERTAGLAVESGPRPQAA